MYPVDRARRTGRRALFVTAALMLAAGAQGQGPGTGADGAAAEGTEADSLRADGAAAAAVVARLHGAFVAMAAGGGQRDARYEALLPVVRVTHDLRFIAELTIRRRWRGLDDATRDRFHAAFERLSVTTYATRFAGVGADTFRFVGSEVLDDGRIEVTAEIVRQDDGNVSLEYVLQAFDEGWRIVNIFADGVSDLALKRAQYQRVLRAGGTIDDVIAEIDDETTALGN